MTIKELKYVPFSLPFSKTFLTAKQKIKNREGFIIRVEDENGNFAYGEAAPLIEFNPETFKDAENQISELSKKIKNLSFDNYISDVVAFIDDLKLLPSVRFSIEQALLGLLLKNDKDFMICQMQVKNSTIIPVNAVFGIGNVEQVFKEISSDINSGFDTVKLKLGRSNLAEEEKLIKMIRDTFGGSIKIRLDANKSWKYDQALANLECLAEFDIEFIEEPCIKIEDTLKLTGESPIPIALDENLNTFNSLNSVLEEGKIKFLVVKPMMIGSIFNLLNFICEASQNNVIIIISSVFETVIGRSALVFLSSAITHEHAHGIGTAEYFQKDLDKDAYPVRDGFINFDPERYPPDFNIEKLFK